MRRCIKFMMAGVLSTAVPVYAGTGDLIVDGNLGVGTTVPGSAIEVKRIETVNRTDLQDLLTINRSATKNPYLGFGSGLLFKGSTYRSGSSSVNWARIYTKLNDHGTSTSGTDLVFQTSPLDDGVLADALIIKYNGKVGIGTTAPAATLDIVVDYPDVTANATQYMKGADIKSLKLPIPYGVTDGGYRVGIAAENFTNDINFKGTLDRQYGVWARVGSSTENPTGTINNSYALLLENIDGGANVIKKFGLYQSNSTAKNFFAGNVGIGTTAPAAKLDVAGDIRANNFPQTSDQRFKKNIAPIHSPLDMLLNISGVTYEWKTDEYMDKGFPEGRHYGVIAQEIEKVLPEVVNTASDGTKAVAYTEIIPVLIEAIKEQQKIIEKQQKALNAQLDAIGSQQKEIIEIRSILSKKP